MRFPARYPLLFRELDEHLVEDRLTNLVWTKNASQSEYPVDWHEALSVVGEMNRTGRFGHADWRLPNRREMRSIVDHSASCPALPHPHHFANINLGWYWTSTTAARAPEYAWYVHLEGGRMFYGRKTDYYWFWPVAGTSGVIPQTGARWRRNSNFDANSNPGSDPDGFLRSGVMWPEMRFFARSDRVLDRLTGLSWYRGDLFSRRTFTWAEALAAVRAFAGQTGEPWRMPTINELESLVDASEHTPALPRDHPFGRRNDGYWTSTSSGFAPDWSYVLYLDKGAVGVGFKGHRDFSLWPVMSEQY